MSASLGNLISLTRVCFYENDRLGPPLSKSAHKMFRIDRYGGKARRNDNVVGNSYEARFQAENRGGAIQMHVSFYFI